MPFTSQVDPVAPTVTNPAHMPSSSVRLAIEPAVQTAGAPPMPQSSQRVPPTNGQLWPRVTQK